MPHIYIDGEMAIDKCGNVLEGFHAVTSTSEVPSREAGWTAMLLLILICAHDPYSICCSSTIHQSVHFDYINPVC